MEKEPDHENKQVRHSCRSEGGRKWSFYEVSAKSSAVTKRRVTGYLRNAIGIVSKVGRDHTVGTEMYIHHIGTE